MWMMAGMYTLLPAIFASVRWPSFEGELSPTGFTLTRFLFSILHIILLALALLTFFDFNYSLGALTRETPVSFFTFYYLGALGVGYFSGYVLLVFGVVRLQAWERRHPLQKLIYRLLYVLTWGLALGTPAYLAWQSWPHIRAGNSHALQQFADETLDGLPAKKAIVLSDDMSRLYLLQADCERRGIKNDQILIDTQALRYKDYILYLVSHYPALKSMMRTNLTQLPQVLASESLMRFMYQVAQTNQLYYLHPSFGYYFEVLYLKPHGLVYEFKASTNTMAPPPLPTEAEITANQAFWDKLEKGPLKPLPELAALDSDVEAVCVDYAVALDYWGTELQKAGQLKAAHDQFAEAIRLNTNNFVASINLQYNERLQRGDTKPIDSAETFSKAMSLYYNRLAPLLRRNGPVDEPGLDLSVGEEFARGSNYCQAAVLFQRRLQLLPDDDEARLAMAKTYVDLRQPAKALELVRELRKTSKIPVWELARCEATAYMAATNYATAEKVLRNAIKEDPNDENRVATLAEYYRLRGLQCMYENKTNEAAHFLTNALTNIDLQLELLQSDRRDTVPTFNVTETLMKRAQVQISLNQHAAAAATLSEVLDIQPKNYNALINRALSEIELKQFNPAKNDFKRLGKILPEQPYLVYFGLAAVAAAETNKVEEINDLKKGIKYVPEGTLEYQRATNRLEMLEHK
jgi:tetratricopeptide (TPR) repeat protein